MPQMLEPRKWPPKTESSRRPKKNMKNSSYLGFRTGMLPFIKYSYKHRYCGNILAAMTVPEHVLLTLSSTNQRGNHVPVLPFRPRDCHSTSLPRKTLLVEADPISNLYSWSIWGYLLNFVPEVSLEINYHSWYLGSRCVESYPTSSPPPQMRLCRRLKWSQG